MTTSGGFVGVALAEGAGVGFTGFGRGFAGGVAGDVAGDVLGGSFGVLGIVAAGFSGSGSSCAGPVAGFHALVVWHCVQSVPNVACSAKLTFAASLRWQSTQPFPVPWKTGGVPTWHPKQSTLACAPVSGHA